MRAATLTTVTILCLASTWIDLRSGKIPNLLTAAFAFLALLLSFMAGGTRGLAGSLSGAFTGLLLLLVPFLLHMVGGGDVKFLAVGGALVGWRLVLLSFLVGAAAGGLMAAVLLAVRARTPGVTRHRFALLRFRRWLPRGSASFRDALTGGVRMPYSVPLAVGLLAVTGHRALAGGA